MTEGIIDKIFAKHKTNYNVTYYNHAFELEKEQLKQELKAEIGVVFRKYYTGGFEVDIDDNTVNVIPQRTLEDFARDLIGDGEKKE